MAVEVEYFLCFRERRLCRRAVGVGTLRGGLRSAVAAGRMGADKPIRICFSGAAPPAPGDELGTQVRPAPCSEACPLAPPYVKENLAGGGNSEGDRARRGHRPGGLNADLAPRSECGRPSGKGQPPTHAPSCRRRLERPVRDDWPSGEVGQNPFDHLRLTGKGVGQSARLLRILEASPRRP